jgi:hypothetical protein
MWLEYLKECLFDEIDIVLNLAGIDQLVQGEKNEVNDIISLLNDNIENLSFYNIKDEELLIDGNPWVLIKVLNDLVEKKNRVVVTKTNLAINKWIIERYKDFLVDNGANCNVDIEIADNFEMKKSTIIIGHKEFVKEMEECLNVDVQTIVEEF